MALFRKSLDPGLDPGQAAWLCNVSFLAQICRLTPPPGDRSAERRVAAQIPRALASALGVGRALYGSLLLSPGHVGLGLVTRPLPPPPHPTLISRLWWLGWRTILCNERSWVPFPAGTNLGFGFAPGQGEYARQPIDESLSHRVSLPPPPPRKINKNISSNEDFF